MELLFAHLQRNVQVEVVLRLELERPIRRFEEREKRAVSETVEGVQHVGRPSGLRASNLQRLGERQPEKILVEPARLFRVAAAISVVMQSANHRCSSGGSQPDKLRLLVRRDEVRV